MTPSPGMLRRRGDARRWALRASLTISAVFGMGVPASARQSEAERWIDIAREAAGDEHVRALSYMCQLEPASRGSFAPEPARGMPDWFAQPVQVFDNLYFLGTRSLNSWAVTTSAGIVIIDPLYDYNVDLSVIRGLEMLGLDPADVTHVIVNHGHGDHYGGARRLQQTFGAEVVMGAADWEMLDDDTSDQPKPDRDVEVDGDRTLVVGDTPFTITMTPGHTPGGTSLLFPVQDGERTHTVSFWGGTSIRAFGSDRARYREYIDSAERFARATREAGADVVLSNHDIFDEAHRKIGELGARAPGESHPFVVGNDAAVGFLDMVRACAEAELSRLEPLAE